MGLDVSSFGDLADVLEALGLANPDGSLNGDWLSAPGDHLKTVLANENQRAAFCAGRHLLRPENAPGNGLGPGVSPARNCRFALPSGAKREGNVADGLIGLGLVG